MTTEQNKALFRQILEEVFNRGNLSKVDELFAPDFIEHEVLAPGQSGGREGVKQIVGLFRSAFPDVKATVEDIVAEGDRVVLRVTWTGTQNGEFMGMPPSGKRVSFEGYDLGRFSGGRIAEHWGKLDSMTMMQQLGAIPAPGQSGG